MSVPELTVESNIRNLEAVPRSLPSLHRAPLEMRALKSGFLSVLTWIAALLASVPLFSVIYELVVAGGEVTYERSAGLRPADYELGISTDGGAR